MVRQGANLKLSFPFMKPTAAAVFNRADTLWIVFDSDSAIDLSALDGESSRTIRAAQLSHDGGADVVRIRLDHPHLSSIAPEGPGWTVTIGDTVAGSDPRARYRPQYDRTQSLECGDSVRRAASPCTGCTIRKRVTICWW